MHKIFQALLKKWQQLINVRQTINRSLEVHYNMPHSAIYKYLYNGGKDYHGRCNLSGSLQWLFTHTWEPFGVQYLAKETLTCGQQTTNPEVFTAERLFL